MGVKGCGVRTAFNPHQREENGFSRELETIAHRANGIEYEVARWETEVSTHRREVGEPADGPTRFIDCVDRREAIDLTCSKSRQVDHDKVIVTAG